MVKGISKYFYSKYNFEKSSEYKEDIKAKILFINNANKKFLNGKAKKLLEVGFGKGPLISSLNRKYLVSGVDKSKENVLSARKNYPQGRYFKADMRNFKTNEKYDMIVSICSIDHGDDLRKEFAKTIKNMGRHLNNKGILIFDAPLALDTWTKEWILAYDGKLIGEHGTLYRFMGHRQFEKKQRIGYGYMVAMKIKGKRIETEAGNVTALEHLLDVNQIKSIAIKNGFRPYVYNGWKSLNPKKGKLTLEPVFVFAK